MDLFNLDETSKFIEKNRPDVVINAAAKVGGIVANNTQRLEFILENLKIILMIILITVKKIHTNMVIALLLTLNLNLLTKNIILLVILMILIFMVIFLLYFIYLLMKIIIIITVLDG